MRTWLNQFGADYAVPAEVTGMLADVSWGNDMCPSFCWREDTQTEPGAVLWVDHPEPAQREVEGYCRFVITKNGEPICSTDDLAEALQCMRNNRRPTT